MICRNCLWRWRVAGGASVRASLHTSRRVRDSAHEQSAPGRAWPASGGPSVSELIGPTRDLDDDELADTVIRRRRPLQSRRQRGEQFLPPILPSTLHGVRELVYAASPRLDEAFIEQTLDALDQPAYDWETNSAKVDACGRAVVEAGAAGAQARASVVFDVLALAVTYAKYDVVEGVLQQCARLGMRVPLPLMSHALSELARAKRARPVSQALKEYGSLWQQPEAGDGLARAKLALARAMGDEQTALQLANAIPLTHATAHGTYTDLLDFYASLRPLLEHGAHLSLDSYAGGVLDVYTALQQHYEPTLRDVESLLSSLLAIKYHAGLQRGGVVPEEALATGFATVRERRAVALALLERGVYANNEPQFMMALDKLVELNVEQGARERVDIDMFNIILKRVFFREGLESMLRMYHRHCVRLRTVVPNARTRRIFEMVCGKMHDAQGFAYIERTLPAKD